MSIQQKIRNLYLERTGKELTAGEYFELERNIPNHIFVALDTEHPDFERAALRELDKFFVEQGILLPPQIEDPIGYCVQLDRSEIQKSPKIEDSLKLAELLIAFSGATEYGVLPPQLGGEFQYIRVREKPLDVPQAFVKWKDVTEVVEKNIVRVDRFHLFDKKGED